MPADTAKPPDPIHRLRGLFDEARQREMDHGTTASLASASQTTRPSVRTVTIVGLDERGPVFFTDRRSGKGLQLSENPQAALCFHWPALHQQIALEGIAVRLAEAEADRYWDRQTREGHLAAWIADTPPGEGEADTLDARLRAVRRRFPDGPVPRPPDWHALRLEPDLCQFWRTGWRRLHVRERYTLDTEGQWHRETSGPL